MVTSQSKTHLFSNGPYTKSLKLYLCTYMHLHASPPSHSSPSHLPHPILLPQLYSPHSPLTVPVIYTVICLCTGSMFSRWCRKQSWICTGNQTTLATLESQHWSQESHSEWNSSHFHSEMTTVMLPYCNYTTGTHSSCCFSICIIFMCLLIQTFRVVATAVVTELVKWEHLYTCALLHFQTSSLHVHNMHSGEREYCTVSASWTLCTYSYQNFSGII